MKGRPLNILMLLQSDYPPDIRLTKEIRALTEDDRRVFLLCNNTTGKKREEVVDRAEVRRLPAFSVLPASWAKILRLPLFFNPTWVCNAVRLIRREKVDVIHVHDLPLAPLAVILGRFFRLPVVYDMHENYPAAMAVWRKRLKGWERLVKDPRPAEKLNQFVLRRADCIIVVVEEQRQNLIEQGVPPEKIIVVGNTAEVEEFLGLAVDEKIVEKYRQKETILYIGSFGVDRGLETAIKAMKTVAERIPDALLLLVGSGKNGGDLRRLAAKENVEQWVEFVDWVPFSQVPSYMIASRIGIIPQPANAANNTTLPHKLFQYMLLKRPVLVSDAAPLKRVVEECRCGLVFRSDNEADFARAAVELLRSAEPFGENGYRKVIEKYNWRETAKTLTAFYQQINQR